MIVVMGGGNGSNLCSATPIFYLDPTVEFDKVMLSIVLSAKVTGLLTWVAASDTCETTWPTTGAQRMSAVDLKG